MEFKNLLPIGSIVLLKNATKKLMIIGLKPIKEDEKNVEYDYLGVLYPEGFLGNNSNYVFCHDDINDIIFTGYSNPEREEFVKLINDALEKTEKD